MIMKMGLRQFGWVSRLVRVLFASAVFIAFITPGWASAQSADDPWSEPVNLSHSGIATRPAIVSDSEGTIHAVWQEEELTTFAYTRLEDGQWRAPAKTNLDRLINLESTGGPEIANHTGPNPLFLAGPGQFIFAFWITPQGSLFTSIVENENFAEVGQWSSARLLARGAASFAAAIDAHGELHLTFLRIADDPANPPGVYYTRTQFGGRNWATPVRLYESPYFRSLEEGEANLSLATTATDDAVRVYVAWDNRPRKQVFLAQSVDGGKNWEQPSLIAGPVPDSGLDGPFNIRLGANQKSVVLVWQSGRPGETCTPIFQDSRDAGATWSEPKPMVEDVLGCARSSEFVTGLANNPQGPLYFLTETQKRISLTVWNGLKWSQPQEQPMLSGFEEPEIYTAVVLGCHQASLAAEQLYIVGCDEGGGGDVWVTSRDLDSTASWFSSPLWSQLSTVTDDELDIQAVELVATADNLIHAFISQQRDPDIFYTYWDGNIWTRITPVLSLPDGEAGWPVIATGPGNELFLITPSSRGSLYFSRSISGNAASESRWSTPARLGISHDGEIGSVDIARDNAGTVHVVYSVPVNEQRGIYLLQSNDQGTTWSEPLQVFDGAAAGFDIVGGPSLLISENGSIHITWSQQSIQGNGEPQPLSLFYARSEDGGRTFNNAEQVVEDPVAWRELASDGEGSLHLLWKARDSLTTVWDQVSPDGGRSWQFPQGLPDEGMTEAIMVNPAGRLHLIDAGLDSLNHWLWEGSRWKPETPLRLSGSSRSEGSVESLAATVNSQGDMMVVLSVPKGTGDAAESTLLYSTRMLELPAVEASNQKIPTQTSLPPTPIPSTPTAENSSTPIPTFDSEPTSPAGQENRVESNARISPFTLALVSVAFLLLGVLGVVTRQTGRVRDQ